MAKRGALDHPKTLKLAAILGVEQAHALGLLEALWHFTIQYAPQGDIGKFTNAVIANGCRTQIAPDVLIDAFLCANCVEEHADRDIRLLVHDWHIHADRTLRQNLKYNNLEFISPKPVQKRRRNSVQKVSPEILHPHARAPLSLNPLPLSKPLSKPELEAQRNKGRKRKGDGKPPDCISNNSEPEGTTRTNGVHDPAAPSPALIEAQRRLEQMRDNLEAEEQRSASTRGKRRGTGGFEQIGDVAKTAVPRRGR